MSLVIDVGSASHAKDEIAMSFTESLMFRGLMIKIGRIRMDKADTMSKTVSKFQNAT